MVKNPQNSDSHQIKGEWFQKNGKRTTTTTTTNQPNKPKEKEKKPSHASVKPIGINWLQAKNANET